MNYREAYARLEGRDRRKLENNTYLHRAEGGVVELRLHGNTIIRYLPNGYVEQSLAGWDTTTTRDRINTYGVVQCYRRRGVTYWADRPTIPASVRTFRSFADEQRS